MLQDFKLYFKIFKKYTWKYRNKIIIGFFISLLFAVFSLATPFLTRFLLDEVLLGKNPALLTKMLFLMIGILILFSFTDISANYLLIKVFQKINLEIKFDFFKKLQSLSLDFFSGKKTGEIMYRLFYDTDVIEDSFSTMPINLVLDILFIIIVGSVMLYWNLKLALFVFLVFCLQIFVIIKFRKPLLKYSKLTKRKSEELSSYGIEHFSGIELIKVSGCEKREQIKFHKKLHELIKISIRYFLLTKFSGTTVNLVNNIWSFGILWFGGMQVIKGRMTIGTLMAFLLLGSILFPPISRMTNTVLSFQDVRASLRRFLEFYNIKPKIKEKKNAIILGSINGKIIFDKVSFGYSPKHLILNNINLEIPPKSIVALVGKSGVGKTTLCRLLMRFYDPLKGKILIDGYDLRDVDLKSYRNQIGLVLQNLFVFSGSIKENICYGNKNVSKEEIVMAAKKANAHDFIIDLPDGYNTEVGERGVKLSGGEAQRIALARIFLKNPKIVILDEPTSFIDLETEEKIKEAILRLRKEATVIIIAHRLSTVKLADKIVVLEDGSIKEVGTHNELIEKKGIYNKLYSQLSI